MLPDHKRATLFGAALAVCIVPAYVNALNGVFLFDDHRVLGEIAQRGWLADPTRPVVSLTFALDQLFFGASPGPYHIVNLFVHLLSALLLFGVLRRALLAPRFRETFSGSAKLLAFGAALIWALHPLQTESVTYITQRMESMMSMFFLLALYCMLRGAEKTAWNAWNTAALAAALLGAGCKQVAAMIPFVALLLDRCFISGSFKASLKRAPGLFAGFCATWLLIGLLLMQASELKAAGLGAKLPTPFEYAHAQFGVITDYLKLAVWPVELCFHYFVSRSERIAFSAVSYAVFICALLGITLWQLIRNTQAGFWSAWFFLILAPTSTVLPILDLKVEHRLYLPLAGLCMLLALGVFSILKRLVTSAAPLTAAALLLLGFGLGVLTFQRNRLYASEIGMWRDVLAKRNGHDPLARVLVGTDALRRGDLKEAREHFEYARNIQADFQTLTKMGELQLAEKDFAGSAGSFQKALDSNPNHIAAWRGLHAALVAQGKEQEAFPALEKLAAVYPGDPKLQAQFGDELYARRKLPEAAQAYALAVRSDPESAALHNILGGVLAQLGRIPEALAEFDQALKRDPKDASALFNRGYSLELTHRTAEAVQNYRASLRENPEQAGAANALAWILATSLDDKLRNGKEAVEFAEKAAALTARKNPLMLDTLAAAYAENAQFENAIESVKAALALLQKGSPRELEMQAHLAKFEARSPLREK